MTVPSRPRRAVKAVAGVGVLAVLVTATGAVVVHELTGSEAVAADADVARVRSADIPLLNAALEPGDLVHVTPASRGDARAALSDTLGVSFAVVVDGKSLEVPTTASTLADALAEAGIVLGWDDVVSADLAAAPQADAEVTIGRGAIEYRTEDVTSPYPTERRETDELPLGETRVVQEGAEGTARTTSEVTLLDGAEVARTTVLTTELTAAVTEIVEVGTSEAPTSARLFTLRELMSAGAVSWGGYRFTYYSQSVLPGGGLAIPGRHINADGYVADADGYIVLANSSPKGTIIDTPFGFQGKVYDRGTVGNHYDVYTQ
ncbi:G5 domain-containing protein [Serinibacter arcticus]|uniref:Beta-galactosidase n=1 Tax=Serinibacter arcticus TaxID=1655435 RepID=A0A4Z1E365_9MICO|nr:G5 domain-containing protein [Serinibacter arcticus]TGO05398.1 Beta-galactosidase [Serinibacter arcticus]